MGVTKFAENSIGPIKKKKKKSLFDMISIVMLWSLLSNQISLRKVGRKVLEMKTELWSSHVVLRIFNTFLSFFLAFIDCIFASLFKILSLMIVLCFSNFSCLITIFFHIYIYIFWLIDDMRNTHWKHRRTERRKCEEDAF